MTFLAVVESADEPAGIERTADHRPNQPQELRDLLGVLTVASRQAFPASVRSACNYRWMRTPTPP
jgi:hypothetical protein